MTKLICKPEPILRQLVYSATSVTTLLDTQVVLN